MYRGFNKKELETEYSPSSCVKDIGVYIKQYSDLSQHNLEVAQTQDALIENIEYGDSPEQKLDLYLPFADTKWQKKLQVYIHGGYWQELSKKESSFAANNFQNHGCHFAVINYALAPKASLTEIIEQNRQALVYLYKNAERLGYDKDQIYISGSSAGAHLAMMMLLTDWPLQCASQLPSNLVKGVCAVSGIFDLEPIALTYINEPLQLTPNEIEKCSPLFHSALNECPVILAYGDNETSEFKRQTLLMQDKLAADDADVTFSEIAERNHFNVILELGEANSWLFQQVRRQMLLEE